MRKPSEDSINALETRLDMLETDIQGLKSQFKAASTINARISGVQSEISDLAFDLNNKIASIRGMLARAEQLKPSNRAYEAGSGIELIETDPAEEALLDAVGLKGKDRQAYYAMKALQQKLKNTAAVHVDDGGSKKDAKDRGLSDRRRFRRASEFGREKEGRSDSEQVHSHTNNQGKDTSKKTDGSTAPRK